MAATDAAALVSASAPDAPAAARSPLSAALLLCRFWTVAALLLALGSLPHAAFFTVREIRIEGTQQIAAADVLARSGLSVGMPVSGVAPDDIARRVATHPRVFSAAVGLTTAGRVTIRVTERSPAAAVPHKGGFAVVDPGGVVIAERSDAGVLPVIAVDQADLPWMRLGTALPSAAIPQAIDALAQLPAALPRAGLTLRRSAAGDLSIVTPDRIVVRLGRVSGLQDRAAKLPQILATVRAQRLALDYIDLRFADNVILKPAPGTGRANGGGVGP